MVRNQDEFGLAWPDFHDLRGENWISDNYGFSTIQAQNDDATFTACLNSFTSPVCGFYGHSYGTNDYVSLINW